MASFTVTASDEPNNTPGSSNNSGSSTPNALRPQQPSPAGSGSRFHVNAAPWVPPSAGGTAGGSVGGIPSYGQAQQSPSSFGLSNSTPSSASTTPSTNRFMLCPHFLQNGFCEGHGCRYAHTFEDLDPVVQGNLLTMLNLGSGLGPQGLGTSHYSNQSSAAQSQVLQMEADPVSGPSARRQPIRHGNGVAQPSTNKYRNPVPGQDSHNSSTGSVGSGAAVCPPSPESQSSEISTVSTGSQPTGGSTNVPPGGTAAMHNASQMSNASSASTGRPAASPNGQATTTASGTPSYGPQASPFIKSQMYYSQGAQKVSLPERCRYPHATPGSYYDYLNVKRCATKEDIIKKYRQWRDDGYKKASAIDAEKADAMDRLIVDAKNILSSERMRTEYDQLLPGVSNTFGAQQQTPSPTASADNAFAKSVLPPTIGESIW